MNSRKTAHTGKNQNRKQTVHVHVYDHKYNIYDNMTMYTGRPYEVIVP